LKLNETKTVKPANWFLIIIGYTVLTLLCVYFIPSNSLLSVFRSIFAFIFVAFVPGYCLVSLLFQEGKLDFAEKVVLSVALSFALAGISGLFIGLSPIGFDSSPITITLCGIVAVLAVLTFLRKLGHLNPHLRRFHAKNQTKVIS
jgi:uncharacterized membrane protein